MKRAAVFYTILLKLVGLNVWVRNGAMTNQEVVERNWVFWSLFCQVSLTV